VVTTAPTWQASARGAALNCAVPRPEKDMSAATAPGHCGSSELKRFPLTDLLTFSPLREQERQQPTLRPDERRNIQEQTAELPTS